MRTGRNCESATPAVPDLIVICEMLHGLGLDAPKPQPRLERIDDLYFLAPQRSTDRGAHVDCNALQFAGASKRIVFP